jgi:hypothetical protein
VRIMNRTVKILILSLSIILVSYVAYEVFTRWQEDKLIVRATRIHKGMRAEEVIDIMGKPNYEGFIDSSKIPAGWDLVWAADYEEVRKKYDKLLFYNYHVKQFKFPSFEEKVGTVQIDICFDSIEQRVVYVSRFYAAE